MGGEGSTRALVAVPASDLLLLFCSFLKIKDHHIYTVYGPIILYFLSGFSGCLESRCALSGTILVNWVQYHLSLDTQNSWDHSNHSMDPSSPRVHAETRVVNFEKIFL